MMIIILKTNNTKHQQIILTIIITTTLTMINVNVNATNKSKLTGYMPKVTKGSGQSRTRSNSLDQAKYSKDNKIILFY